MSQAVSSMERNGVASLLVRILRGSVGEKSFHWPFKMPRLMLIRALSCTCIDSPSSAL